MGKQLHARHPRIIVENVYGVFEAIEKNGQSKWAQWTSAKFSKVEQRGRLTSRIIHRTGYNDIRRRYGVRYRCRCRCLYFNSQNPFKTDATIARNRVDLKEALRTISPRRCFPTLFVSTTHNMYNAALEWRWLRLVKWRFCSNLFIFFQQISNVQNEWKGEDDDSKIPIENERGWML